MSCVLTGEPRCVIRVLIVTDVSLFREGLARLLNGRSDLEVVATAAPRDDVLALLALHRPDVVVVDAATVRASELAIQLALAPAPVDTRVVAFAVAEEDEIEVLACAEAGVAGFVSRSATVDELVAVLKSAVSGQVLCPPQIAALVFRQVAKLAVYRSVTADERGLTLRETEIASLIEGGLTNKEIASRLGIEVATVKNHVHNILEKLHVRRRGDVAAIARSQRRWRRPDTAAASPLAAEI
jgi:DNA-binding NarL/FixJ family response regulator